MPMSCMRCAVVLSFAMLVSGPMHAQSFPSKPLRLIVPFAPGGNVDITARTIGQPLGQALGQQVVVENRSGAGGQIGAEAVAKAAADGYTLMMASSSVMTNAPAVYPKLRYDILGEFAPVGRVSEVPLVLVVHPGLPAHTTKQFIALAKARPGEILMASSDRGTTSHLIAELFGISAGIRMTIVPYKGAGPAVSDLLGGHVVSRIDQIPSSMPHIQSKRLRAIAVTTRQRAAAVPDLPTMHESGLPGFEASTVTGVLAPAATPPAILDRLNGVLLKVLADPAVAQRFTALGAEVRPSTRDELARFIREDIAKWRKVAQQAGIRPE